MELPASTPWPLVSALGLALVFAGMATSAAVSAVGAVLAVVGVVGWFREVFPHGCTWRSRSPGSRPSR